MKILANHWQAIKMLIEEIPDFWVGGKDGMRQKYLSLMRAIRREGVESFLSWLTLSTDFFEAPASSNGHNNYAGGLVEHSLVTFYNLTSMIMSMKVHSLQTIPAEIDSLILTALCHDICKANFYKGSFKQQKRIGTDGKECLHEFTKKPIWDTVPYYSIDDQFPVGHGEKSVIILQKFIELSNSEIAAIRWHMGGFDDTARSYAGGLAVSNAMAKYPLVAFLHCADLIASLPDLEETRPVINNEP